MGYVKWSYEELKKFCLDVFQAFGFSKEDSSKITDVLLLSDLYGIESHGIQRMVMYHKGIERGIIHPQAKPEVVFETPVSAVIDGHNGMGQLISAFAMEKAIEKAKKVGISMVVVRESNHYGIAGYYAKMACDQGLIGLCCTNTEAIMIPTYGKQAMLGTNPIAVAMPADPYPFFLDFATTVVPRGKLEVYSKANKEIPLGWAVDINGQDSVATTQVLHDIMNKNGGGILPLGGSSMLSGSHKGYGFGMLCEIFSAILAMGVTSDGTWRFPDKTGLCHGFMVIDPAIFGNAESIKEYFSEYLQKLRESPKADGQDRIYTHGEKEIEAEKDRMENGIPVNDKTMAEFADLCQYLKLDFQKYFPGYVLE